MLAPPPIAPAPEMVLSTLTNWNPALVPKI